MAEDLYKVVVVPKSEIIETIQKNILDGEILKDIIDGLERTAAESISNCAYTSLPYIGSVKPDLRKYSIHQNREILKDARDNKTKEDYLVFKRNLTNSELLRIEAAKKVEHYKDLAKRRYKRLYNKIADDKGELYAVIAVYCKIMIKPCKHGIAEVGYSIVIDD